MAVTLLSRVVLLLSQGSFGAMTNQTPPRSNPRGSPKQMTELPDEVLLQSNFVRNHDVGTAVVSPDGHWLKVNQQLCDMLGYEEEELLAMTFQEITLPEDLEAEQPYLQRLTAGSIDHYQFKKRYRHKDGSIVWGVLNRSAVRNAERAVVCFVSHIRDITAEKNAEPKPSTLQSLAAVFGKLFRRHQHA